MFSILDFDTTTREQVDKAVEDGLIHPTAAKEWLLKKSSQETKSTKRGYMQHLVAAIASCCGREWRNW